MIGRVMLPVAVALAFALGLGAAGPAPAQVSPPPVSFLSGDTLEVTEDAVRTGAGVRILVHNDGTTRLAVSVRVLGLTPRDGFSRALRVSPPTLSVGAGSTRAWTLEAPGDPPAATEPSYTGTIVASAAGGPPARQKLTITTDAKPAVIGQKAGNERLAPKDATGLTIPATNFLPSVLSPVGPALWAAGVLGFALALAFWAPLRTTLRRRLALGAAAALLAVGAALDAVGEVRVNDSPFVIALALLVAAVFVVRGSAVVDERRPIQRPSSSALVAVVLILLATIVLAASATGLPRDSEPEHVEARHVPVSGVADATLGRIVEGDADVAALHVADGELVARGLDDAGAYKGKVKLGESDLEVTVNVRDWWPWALLTLLAGVALGAVTRRWFDIVRPRMKLQDEAEALLDRAQEGERERARKRVPRDPPSVLRHMRFVLDEARALQAAGDTAEAAKALLAAQAYLRRFDGLIGMLEELDRDAAELTELGTKVELKLKEIPTAAAATTVARGGELDELRSTEKELADRVAAADPVHERTAAIVALARRADEVRREATARGEGNLLAQGTQLLKRVLKAPIDDDLQPLTRRADDLEARLASRPPAPSRQLFGSTTLGGPRAGAKPRRARRQRSRARRRPSRLTLAELDVQMTAIGALVAVGSGLLAVYFTDPVWGSAEDYLQALLWAGFVGEGFKWVTALVGRRLA